MPKTIATTAYGWRVKLYRLNVDGSWDDCGTGRISCRYSSPPPVEEEKDDDSSLSAVELVYKKLNNPILCMHAEVDEGILLQTRVLLRETYQRQGDNIITWCEPSCGSSSSLAENDDVDDIFRPKVPESPGGGRIDLALSFQDNAGCLDIWNQIALVQQKAMGYISQAISMQQNQQQYGCDHTAAAHNKQLSASSSPQRNSNLSSSAVKKTGMNVVTASAYDSSISPIVAATKEEASSSTESTARQGRFDSEENQLRNTEDDNTNIDANCQNQSTTTTTASSVYPPSASSMQTSQQQPEQCTSYSSSCFPDPPQPHNLEDIAEIIHAAMNNCQSTITPFFSSSNTQLQNYLLMHQHQESMATSSVSAATSNVNPPPSRDDVSKALLDNDFLYFRKLLNLFPLIIQQHQQQQQQSSHSKNYISILCALASIIKMILFLNLEPLLEYVVENSNIFLQILQTMEYDPELRTLPARHVHFLMNEIKFKTVIWINDTTFENSIHKCWRISYLKDTVLRPTMVEEGSISTLANLLQRTHVDILRFVGTTVSSNNTEQLQDINSIPDGNNNSNKNRYEDCYLAQIIRMLGTELYSIAQQQQIYSSREATEATTHIRETKKDADFSVIESANIQQQKEDVDSCTSTTTTGMLPEHRQTVSKAPCSSPSVDVKVSPSYVSNNDGIEIWNDRNNSISTSKNNLKALSTSPWKQHLLPQDSSLHSRKMRRQGCLQFLRELFIMVRTSLQHSEKCDFYVGICLMDVTLHIKRASSCESAHQEAKVVNLLQLLGLILSDINGSTIEEKSSALEIIFSIACFDSSLIRRHVMDETCQRPARPCGSAMIQFPSSENDLLLSLCTLMATEDDIGLLLQALELLRVLLDTDIHHTPILQDGDHHSEFPHDQQHDNGAHFYEEIHDEVDDEIFANALGTTTKQHNQSIHINTGSKTIIADGADIDTSKSDRNKDATEGLNGDASNSSINAASLLSTNNPFLGLFYDYYIYWLVAPFQFPISIPIYNGISDSNQASTQLEKEEDGERHCKSIRQPMLRPVPKCAVRANFVLEILCFCVRAHGYRMKNFVLRSRMLLNVLQLLVEGYGQSGDQCLKLAVLRFLRAIISAKDEFYSRHIVQHDLFAPVFELLLSQNPVGDNLVSSSIIEICDYIKNDNLKTLLEYIVTRFIYNTQWRNTTSRKRLVAGALSGFQSGSVLSKTTKEASTNSAYHLPDVSLESLSEQHVHTFKQMRQKYEENLSKPIFPVSSTAGHILRRNKDSQGSCSDENEETTIVTGEGKHALCNGSMSSTMTSHYHQGFIAEGGEGTAAKYTNIDAGNDPSTLPGRGLSSSLKALEDQRKFREVDDEESYFNDDDDDGDVEQDVQQNTLPQEELIPPQGHQSSNASSSLGVTVSSASRIDDVTGERIRSEATGLHCTTNPLADSQPSSMTLAPSWMPVQYGDSSDEEDELESSCSSADDTDSSVSSIITYASSTSDLAKEDFDDWRAAKRARVHYGTNSGDDEDSCNNGVAG